MSALMRVATTGIYLLRRVPFELQRAARVRAVSDGTPRPGDKHSAA